MNNQRGAVALLTTIIISLLMLLIVSAMVSMMVGELRQATDSDQSLRAYYAAEAGAEEAVLQLKKWLRDPIANPIAFNTCGPTTTVDSNLDITCKKIGINTNAIEGAPDKEEATQIDLSGLADDFKRMKLQWNLPSDVTVPWAPFSNPPEFPRGSAWTYPALMEVNIISYPQVAFNSSEIEYKTYVAVPSASGWITEYNVTAAAPSSPLKAQCQAPSLAEPYSCVIDFDHFDDNRNYIIRLRPRYDGTHYRLTFFNNNGAGSGGVPVPVPDQYATIDVTARSGPVYRRVIQKVRINSGVVSGLDYVLFSDTDICKDFFVRDSKRQAFDDSCGAASFSP